MLTTPAAIIAAFLFGLLWGSFLNVAVYRLPKTEAAAIGGKLGLSYLAWPLSFCPHCRMPIPPRHNIPLLSYLWLRGESKCCRRRISGYYPLGELVAAVAMAVVVARFGITLDAALAAIFLSFLLVAAAIDLRRYYLPDILTLPLLWLGLLVNVDARFALLSEAVVGAAAGYVGLWLLAAVFSAVARAMNGLLQRFAKAPPESTASADSQWRTIIRKRLRELEKPMGGGDFKLLAALGAWTGVYSLPLTLFAAAAAGLLLAAVRFAVRGRGGRIPFGVGLSLAGFLMLLFAEEITAAYLRFVL